MQQIYEKNRIVWVFTVSIDFTTLFGCSSVADQTELSTYRQRQQLAKGAGKSTTRIHNPQYKKHKNLRKVKY